MIYFLLYLFLEIFISVEIASAIGPFWTFVEVIGSAMGGLLLLANFRYTFFENMQALVAGEITPETFQKHNIAALIGALLLIVPGFFTDLIGITLQFGIFANLLAAKMTHKGSCTIVDSQNNNKEGEYDVIDVEVIEPANDRR